MNADMRGIYSYQIHLARPFPDTLGTMAIIQAQGSGIVPWEYTTFQTSLQASFVLFLVIIGRAVDPLRLGGPNAKIAYAYLFSTIKHIPGPFLAASTSLPWTYYGLKKKRASWITSLHQKYGKHPMNSPD